MPHSLRILCLLLFVTSAALTVSADSVTYTFEAPQFTFGTRTPLLDQRPNIGSQSFTASFLGSRDFSIGGFPFNDLFSGQNLWSDDPTASIRIELNTFIDTISFDWAVSRPSTLYLQAPPGFLYQDSVVVGGDFQGGTVNFQVLNLSGQPALFNQFQLSVSNFQMFAIDNLRFSSPFIPPQPIPEPATMILLGSGLVGIAARVRKRRQAR